MCLPDKIEPGLALTRSLGDSAAAQVGVTYTPELRKLELSTSDKFVIVGSDGIWDKLSNFEAVSMVAELLEDENGDLAAKRLVSKAAARWGG